MDYPSLPVEFPHNYATHVPLLAVLLASLDASLRQSGLDIIPALVEFGSGYHSTPLIAAFARSIGAEHIIIETDEAWLKKAVPAPILSRATVHLVRDSRQALKLLPDGIALAFVDCEAAARREVIEGLREIAGVVVVHDTEPEDDFAYKVQKPLGLYRFRFDDATYTPHTTAVSDRVDIASGLSELFPRGLPTEKP